MGPCVNETHHYGMVHHTGKYCNSKELDRILDLEKE